MTEERENKYVKRTARTETMYNESGVVYVYLVYGMHYLFNKGYADAMLIRAIEPTDGLEQMFLRRNMTKNGKLLTCGPGRLAQALGIDKSINGISLHNKNVWIEEREVDFYLKIEASKRIGVDYAGEDAKLPWRFSTIGNMFVSK